MPGVAADSYDWRMANSKGRRPATKTPDAHDTALVMERSDVAAVLASLEAGRPVRAKIMVGDRRAPGEVLDHLIVEVARLGGRFVDDPANDVNPGDRWRRIEPPHGTGRDRAEVTGG